ncbi:orotidine 5'-phosphate decarboxylase / HUMPS family protein [Enterococcus hirae]|nr:orotidine 5'-phosphate decarboxylase / HUMPS family protein [Enterococcus hirae]
MKLQAAIDRVDLADAVVLAAKLNTADIVEVGTSLIKDYGLEAVREIKKVIGTSQLLADIKTIDEGEYEFRQFFDAGADILTVMGASSPETLEICYQVTQEYEKEMLIDLLECSAERIAKIAHFKEAIYGMHFSKDSGRDIDVVKEVNQFIRTHPAIKRLALAGSLNLEKVKKLQKTPLEIAIVGSAIVSSTRPANEIKKFKEVMK